jgi:uncharacterized membrane protein YeaQ/YmgE (transglycosylase-associated protein family)
MHLLVWLISGVIAGWLTGLIVRGEGFGLVGDLIIGLLGGLIGGWLFGFLGIATTGWIGEILAAVVGGVVLVATIRVLRRA